MQYVVQSGIGKKHVVQKVEMENTRTRPGNGYCFSIQKYKNLILSTHEESCYFLIGPKKNYTNKWT